MRLSHDVICMNRGTSKIGLIQIIVYYTHSRIWVIQSDESDRSHIRSYQYCVKGRIPWNLYDHITLDFNDIIILRSKT